MITVDFLVAVGAGIAGIIAIFAIYLAATTRRARLKFLREAPSEIQSRMETVRESLAAGAGHLETAERELEAATAPLFWDAMDDFAPAIEPGRTAWNGAVDIAERVKKLSAGRPRSGEDDAIAPDASLPATIVEMGEKWVNLRRQALGNEHFASIFEQRRQADKIADRLKKQGEQIQTAIDGARRAELAASQAAARAEQAVAQAGKADARARKAVRRAGRADSAARQASSTAQSAAQSASAAVSKASWSKI